MALDEEALAVALPAIMEAFASARERYSAADLVRVEEAFMIASGAAPPVASPDPLQRPQFYLPGLTSRPWHEAATLDVARRLEANYETIRGELLGVLARRRGFQPHCLDGEKLRAPEWNALYLKFDPGDFSANRALCPATTRIVEEIPRLGETVMFSALNPGGHIKPHCGPWNFRLTVHLGLVVPDGCGFRVGSETRTWQEGRCLVFDDSFEHEAWNRGDATRFVLLVDVWHPDLNDAEVYVLDAVRRQLSAALPTLGDVATQRDALHDQQWWK